MVLKRPASAIGSPDGKAAKTGKATQVKTPSPRRLQLPVIEASPTKEELIKRRTADGRVKIHLFSKARDHYVSVEHKRLAALDGQSYCDHKKKLRNQWKALANDKKVEVFKALRGDLEPGYDYKLSEIIKGLQEKNKTRNPEFEVKPYCLPGTVFGA